MRVGWLVLMIVKGGMIKIDVNKFYFIRVE